MVYQFNMDRYHAVMGKFFIGENAKLPDGRYMGDVNARFYVTQRKAPYAPVLGHTMLSRSLIASQIDDPHARFLAADRADLSSLARKLSLSGSFMGKIRIVDEGTIMFANEPIADVTGPLWNVQLHEVIFEHAFDVPMSVGYRAMKLRDLVGRDSFLSVFSLRRDGDEERSIRVSDAAFISGFDDTSDMEASFQLGMPDVGTMAHYLSESGVLLLRPGGPHFEQLVFERWLDDNPKGTVLLIDTFGYKDGLNHAIAAAMTTPARRTAFKAVRLDSGDLAEAAEYCREELDKHGLNDVGLVLTGDLDIEGISRIQNLTHFPIMGYGIGTKLAAEAKVSGVIFKMSEVDGIRVLKTSDDPAKATLPGDLHVWRCMDEDGMFVKDIIALRGEDLEREKGVSDMFQLLHDFSEIYRTRSPHSLKAFVKWQLSRFKKPLEKYVVERSPGLERLIKETTRRMIDGH